MTNSPSDMGPKQRSGAFKVVLVLFSIGILTTFANFFMADQIAKQLNISTTPILFLGFLGLVGGVGVVGIWLWKKWGLYVYVGVGAVVFVINLFLGLGIVQAALGMVGVVLIAALSKQHWHFFE